MGIRAGFKNYETGLINPEIPFAHRSDVSMEQIGMKKSSDKEMAQKASRGYTTLISGRPESMKSYQVVQQSSDAPWVSPARR